MERIRIAYVIDFLTTGAGGTEKQLLKTIENLDKSAFEPFLIFLTHTPWTRTASLPCPYVDLGFEGFLKVSFPAVLWRFRKLLRQRQFHIVHTFFKESVFVCYLAGLGLGPLPVMLSSRRDIGLGISELWYAKLYNLLMPIVNHRFDGIVVNGRNIKKYVMRKEMNSGARIKVIANGIDVPKAMEQEPALFSRHRAEFWIGLAANLNKVKRIDLFLHALSMLKKSRPDLDFRAVMMGEGPEMEALSDLTESLGLSDRVHFTGSVQNVISYLQRLHVGVLCSDREGFSNSILEYMSCGLPVVATDVGGNPELVDESNGCLVPCGDAQALSGALQKLSEDAELRVRMGKASREKVDGVFSWTRTMADLESYYKGLMLERSPDGFAPDLVLTRISEADFSGMKEEWDGLLSRSASDTIFLRWEWVQAWWKHFNRGRELCIIAVRRGNALVGLAPFYMRRMGPWPGIGLLALCGSEDLSPNYLDFIVERGLENEVLVSVFKFLRRSVPGWHMVRLENLLEESVLRRYGFMAPKFLTQIVFSSVCPAIKLKGTYEDLLKEKFDRKKRHNLERQTRIAFDQKGLVHQEVALENLTPALEALFLLHEKRKKEKGISSAFTTKTAKRFHADFSERLMRQGELSFHMLYDGRSPVSASYGYVYKRKFYFYQSGMDPDWGKAGVGNVLLSLVIKKSCEDGLEEFDFLKGGHGYKLAWSNRLRVQCDLRLFKNDFQGILLYTASQAKSTMKSACLNGAAFIGLASAQGFSETNW